MRITVASRLVWLTQARSMRCADLRPVVAELRRTGAFRREAFRKRELEKLMGFGSAFGIISAYRSRAKHDNQEANGALLRDLQRLGYRPTQLRGSWEGVTEKSWIVPNIKPSDLFDLGRQYDQDAVIYKTRDGVLGMYHTKGTPRVELAVDPEGDPVFEVAINDSLFSKARGLSFGFGFLWEHNIPWDGSTPIGRKRMRALVETIHAPAIAEALPDAA